ncbi:hypothetical protein V2W45_1474468 [Cenococcum geophilum]
MASTEKSYILNSGFKDSMSCWLIEVAHGLPGSLRPHVHLFGPDISTTYFPARGRLSETVTMEALSGLSDIPAELVGVFDVVHVRAFTAVIKNNNPTPLAANAIKMLKPGGYLQWDELDMGSLMANSISVKETMSAFTRLDKIFQEHDLNVLKVGEEINHEVMILMDMLVTVGRKA